MTDETALTVIEHEVSLGTLHATDPVALVSGATAMANVLADVIEKGKLYSVISRRKHVHVEGWMTLATMMGCLPREVSNERDSAGNYVATVELVRLSDGAVLCRASASCGVDEPTWAGRAEYARRSMAATRAVSKACRLAFSWVMVLAGYSPTPDDEMPKDEREPRAPAPSRPVKADAAGPVWPFGKMKGRPLADMSDAELIQGRDWCADTDAEKFEKLIGNVNAELESRKEQGG